MNEGARASSFTTMHPCASCGEPRPFEGAMRVGQCPSCGEGIPAAWAAAARVTLAQMEHGEFDVADE